MLKVQGAGWIEQGSKPDLKSLLTEQVSELVSSPDLMLIEQVARLEPEPEPDLESRLMLIWQKLYCEQGLRQLTQASWVC